MDTRNLGSLSVTVVGIGTNNFGYSMSPEAVPPVVDAALEAGINFFDTADAYGESEARLGQALGRRRDEVLIATKFGSPVAGEEGSGGARPEYIRIAVERSLRRLDTDRIDLYQLHRPDPSTPIAETLGALGELVRAGKVREIGCSNFDAAQLREADAAAGDGPKFVSVQNRYNVLRREDEAEVLPLCEQLGMTYLPYGPLESGVLTGKYVRGQKPPAGTRLNLMGERFPDLLASMLTESSFDRVDLLSEWAGKHDHSLLDLAFAWLLSHPVVPSIIAGATRPSQVAANAATSEWRLSAEERDEIDALV